MQIIVILLISYVMIVQLWILTVKVVSITTEILNAFNVRIQVVLLIFKQIVQIVVLLAIMVFNILKNYLKKK